MLCNLDGKSMKLAIVSVRLWSRLLGLNKVQGVSGSGVFYFFFLNFIFLGRLIFFPLSVSYHHLLSTDYMLGPVLSSFLCIALFNHYSDSYFYPPFTDEETEAPKLIHLPKVIGQGSGKVGFEPRSF